MKVSRRHFLVTGTAFAAGYAAIRMLPIGAAPAPTGVLSTRFMQLSSLLVNHQLDTGVGARIAEAAAAQHADLGEMLDKLIAIAQAKQAKVVEDFFTDIPAGPLQDFAYWVIFAWYSGVSSPKNDAKVFTYEHALTFQTTRDVTTVPSYGISGPNLWSHAMVPLVPMPAF